MSTDSAAREEILRIERAALNRARRLFNKAHAIHKRHPSAETAQNLELARGLLLTFTREDEDDA